MLAIDEYRITQIQRRSYHIGELERRIRFSETQISDSDQPTDRVGVRDARKAEIRVSVRPAPGARESFAGAPYLVVLARQLEANGAVTFGASQSVGHVPRQRQQEPCVANDRRIDDDVLAETARVALLLLDARRKDSPEIPVPILVLPDVHEGVFDFEVTEEDASVE